MMSRTVTCINGEYQVTFGEDSFSPFLLAGIDGIYEARNNLVISKNAMSDGGTFQGSTAEIRNITLRIMVEPLHVWRQDVRDLLYQLFSKDSDGLLIYEENGNKRQIRYKVEAVEQSEWKKRLFFVYLQCPDSFFYASHDIRHELGTYDGAFEFIHEFIEDGEEFGVRSNETIATIENDTGTDGIGLNIKVKCVGVVTNPSFVKIQTNEVLSLGTSSKPLNLVFGDVLEITTATNNKHVYLNGEEINQYLTEDAEFIQLSRGTNSIGYEASSGAENMQVIISYVPQYEGA